MEKPLIGGLYLTKQNTYAVLFESGPKHYRLIEIEPNSVWDRTMEAKQKFLKTTTQLSTNQFEYREINKHDIMVTDMYFNCGYCGRVTKELLDAIALRWFMSHL